jgi:hypothetical protein
LFTRESAGRGDGTRALAATILAGELGIESPAVELVEIDGVRGSLQPVVGEDADRFEKRDPDGFARILADPGNQATLLDVEAFDYLGNNPDRQTGWRWEQFAVADGDSSPGRLVPIHNDLSDAAGGTQRGWDAPLPKKVSVAMHQRLATLAGSWPELPDSLAPYLPEGGVATLRARLDDLLAVPVEPEPAQRPGAAGGLGGATAAGAAPDPALLEAVGPVARALTKKPGEVPFRRPPVMFTFSPGHPLAWPDLDPSTGYLWMIDPDGGFRVAPEEQPGFHPSRSTVNHGDMVAEEDMEDRGEGRIGGELRAELRAGAPTGRWIMDNDSSFSGVRSDGLDLGPEYLEAAVTLLGSYGTDVSPIVLKPFGSQ